MKLMPSHFSLLSCFVVVVVVDLKFAREVYFLNMKGLIRLEKKLGERKRKGEKNYPTDIKRRSI